MVTRRKRCSHLTAFILTLLSVVDAGSLTGFLDEEISPKASHMLPSHGIDENGNDEDLGRDWLADPDMKQEMDRIKRAAGFDISGNTTFTMKVVASQTKGLDAVDIGDSFTIEAVIDLPGVAIADKSDLKFEVFGLNQDKGVAGFHICQAHMEKLDDTWGAQINAIQTVPVYTDTFDETDKNYVRKTEIELEQLHTSELEDTGNQNKVQIQFQAVVVNLPEVVAGQKYFLTAGAEYGNENYIWIGQLEMTMDLQPHDYDVKISFPSPPDAIEIGKSMLFTISAFITEPNIDLEMVVFQPLGYNDLFHIGKISREMGNAFACSPEDKWEDMYRATPTGLTWNKVEAKYDFLVNREALRDVGKDVNKITFSIPVHVLNSNEVLPNVKRSLAFGLKIGNKKLWSALHEIQIKEYMDSGDTVGTPTVNSTDEELTYSTNTTGANGIMSGDAAIYVVKVVVQPGYCDFNVELSTEAGDATIKPVGARILDPGTIGYFPPVFAIQGTPNDTAISMNWGTIHNPSEQKATTVLVELTYAITPTAVSGSTKDLTATIGGQLVTLHLDIVDLPEDSATIEVINLDDPLPTATITQFGVASFDLKVTVPSQSGKESIRFEAVPDLTATTPPKMRLCSVEIRDIGRALPCLYHTNVKSQEIYTKSNDDQDFFDSGYIDIPQLCPVSYNGAQASDNVFIARVAYEFLSLPDDLGDGDSLNVNSGVKLGDAEIVVANKQIAWSTTPALETYPDNAAFLQDEHMPFFVSYPTISTRDKATPAFDRGEGLFVQYIIKTVPGTSTPMTLTLTPPLHIKICKVVITHIGDNLPCMEAPPLIATPYDNVKFMYPDEAATCGAAAAAEATVEFKNVHNVAQDGSAVDHDLAPDDHSIQIKAFFQVCSKDAPVAVPGNFTIAAILKKATGTAHEVLDEFTIETTEDELPPYDGQITETNITSLIGPNDIIYKKAPKLMQLAVPIPQGYLGDVEVRVRNAGYASGIHVDLCEMHVLEIGKNLPCVTTADIMDVTMSDEVTELEPGDNMYEYMALKVKSVCQVQIEPSVEANYIILNAAIRVRDDIAATEIEISVDVVPQGGETQIYKIPMTMQIEDPEEGDIAYDEIDVTSEALVTFNNTVDPIIFEHPKQIETVKYLISFPAEKTLIMEASLLVPSTDEGVAMFHVRDVRFGNIDRNGSNVLCTGPGVNLKKTYSTVFSQTSKIQTMMQHDAVTVDLGYIVNNANTMIKANYDEYQDNMFVLEFDLEKSDVWPTATDQKLHMAVKFGKSIIVVDNIVQLTRPTDDTIKGQLPIINVEANQTDSAKIYNINETIHINGIVSHDNASMGEAYPLILRVMSPQFVTFDNSSNATDSAFSSNYTNQAQAYDDALELNYDGITDQILDGLFTKGHFDLVFKEGFTFHDVSTFELKMKVDPLALRLVGSGLLNSSIVVAPYCQVIATNDGAALWPISAATPAADLLIPCGPPVAIQFTLDAPECEDPIPLIDPCQVQASTMISDDRKPYYSLEDDAVKAWSPALRTGAGWGDYLEYDFLGVARINKVKIGYSTTIFSNPNRAPKRVKIQSSFVPNYFTDIVEQDVSSDNNTVYLPAPTLARYLRIVILETTYGDETEAPLAVKQVQWLGCMPKGFVMADHLAKCRTDMTIDSSNRKLYRHFAVDTFNSVVYFCDRSQYRSGMQCFSSYKGPGSLENDWHELPRYVSYIEGFSEDRGRMYLRDSTGNAVLSSMDGYKLELTESTPDTLTEAMEVPGMSSSELGVREWSGTDYRANFDGIFKGDVPLAYWKTCCTKP